MPFKNGKYFNSITIQSVDNAISSVNELSNVRNAYFWYCPPASRVIRQKSLCMINDGIDKPGSALHTVTCNELRYIDRIFASFP